MDYWLYDIIIYQKSCLPPKKHGSDLRNHNITHAGHPPHTTHLSLPSLLLFVHHGATSGSFWFRQRFDQHAPWTPKEMQLEQILFSPPPTQNKREISLQKIFDSRLHFLFFVSPLIFVCWWFFRYKVSFAKAPNLFIFGQLFDVSPGRHRSTCLQQLSQHRGVGWCRCGSQ